MKELRENHLETGEQMLKNIERISIIMISLKIRKKDSPTKFNNS
jgi:hypothetical protein